ncbi:hypothetical protein [Kordia sp.]|uniref:hypothetical protein n=1 Tax=Kordia sp. TaxID=1965332 RepID=UPI003B58C041
MKKKNLKNLSLNRKTVSKFTVDSVKGGMVSARCSDLYYEDDNGYIICCTFVGPDCVG